MLLFNSLLIARAHILNAFQQAINLIELKAHLTQLYVRVCVCMCNNLIKYHNKFNEWFLIRVFSLKSEAQTKTMNEMPFGAFYYHC